MSHLLHAYDPIVAARGTGAGRDHLRLLHEGATMTPADIVRLIIAAAGIVWYVALQAAPMVTP
jgi:hypothetical protein